MLYMKFYIKYNRRNKTSTPFGDYSLKERSKKIKNNISKDILTSSIKILTNLLSVRKR